MSSGEVLLLACCLLTWLASTPPVFPNRGYRNAAWCGPVPGASQVFLVGLVGPCGGWGGHNRIGNVGPLRPMPLLRPMCCSMPGIPPVGNHVTWIDVGVLPPHPVLL